MRDAPGKASGFFITGTDTGVGKTVVACALLRGFAARGKAVVGMKPIAAGTAEDGETDVQLLCAASNVAAPRELVNPYALPLPVAPHIAARHAGVDIELAVIEHAFSRLTKMAELVIVEGVGGFKVPLNAHDDTTDLAQRLRLPVILVVGMRLGCLNHALLTAEAIFAAKLKLAGWIANRIDPAMQAFDANLQALGERLPCPLIATLEMTLGKDPELAASSLSMLA